MRTPFAAATAERPRQHEQVCGDVASFCPLREGVLLCLADGLGHGEQARVAALRATAYVHAHAEAPLETLIRDLDRELRGTRGAAVSLVSLLSLGTERQRLRYVSIGNVELRALSQSPIAPPAMPGIVGEGLRRVRVWDYPLHDGDLLVLFSDGVSTRFELADLAALPPQALADTLLARQHKLHDDASCVVARLGRP